MAQVETAPKPAAQPESLAAKDPAYVLGFTMADIDGKERKLSEHAGKVVLMVNVASRCGLTPQYEQLQGVYEKFKKEGLVVLAFPANNFGEQEPGTNSEIKAFCTSRYGVTFPVFAKISVKGDDQHGLYKRLTGQPEPIGGEVKWNFTKFLVDRSGRVVARFEPRTRPDDPEVIDRIVELLGQPAPSASGSTGAPSGS
ncbi:MAG: glutathione peroxidase [Leptolyngbya sp. PLA2]|nr:glutathione peroxidase [Leptolyngbya sp. PL-A2]MCQ3940220.1 glutathione peroxidase [cyanobacterium CYA1]